MPAWDAGVLLGDLALEEVSLGAVGSDGVEGVALDAGSREVEGGGLFVGEDDEEIHGARRRVGRRVGEEGGDALALADGGDDEPPEVGDGESGDALKGGGLAVLDGQARVGAHGWAPT